MTSIIQGLLGFLLLCLALSGSSVFSQALARQDPGPAAFDVTHSGAASSSSSPSDRLKVSTVVPKQGETIEITLHPQSGVTPPAVRFNKKEYKFFPLSKYEQAATMPAAGSVEDVWRALIGIPADLEPGTYKIEAGQTTTTIVVRPGGFSVQRLRLPKDKDNFISSPGEEEAVKQAKKTITDEQLWRGKFAHPSQARTSTGFGQRRIVNGHMLKDYFHTGLDFAGSLGSPVLAAQRGKVILAHTGWKLHGNVIALDHGQGVISFYIHLSKIKVKEGDLVEAGDEIGKIGMTGRANGPHLHFSLYVNDEATNPLDWFARAY